MKSNTTETGGGWDGLGRMLTGDGFGAALNRKVHVAVADLEDASPVRAHSDTAEIRVHLG